ncbi:unnamed protein product [Cylicocyclus nassatus]|uniref:Chitin-binding type-2 domain-containing protein n=1 Tax=Cylicocyclus nassatus TaxID=53992 RepID=A0AA36HH53_CYLNA|nr:unnamed protein product [Cylicocyclus nassatus]
MIRLTLLTLFVGLALSYPEGRMGNDFCKQRQPGLFGEGCSPNVTVCNSLGKEISLICPFELVFDESVEECVDYRMSPNCTSEDEQALNETMKTLADLPIGLCENSSEGFHALTDCSTTVIRCILGKPSLMECPNGQVYDKEKSQCVDPSDLDSCNSSEEETTIDSTTEDSSSSNPILGNALGGCEKLADGFYEYANCSSYYMTCSGGIARIMRCQDDLIYDRLFGVCSNARDVGECGAQIETAAEICKEDGFFSYGNCSDLFYACTNGRQITMHCPANLVFDEAKQSCEYPETVAVCSENSSGYSGEESGFGEASGKESGSGAVPGEEYGSGESDSSSGEVSGEHAKDASGVFSGEASGEYSGNALAEFSGEFAGEFSGKATGDFAGETQGQFRGEAAGEISGDFSGEAEGYFSGQFSGEFSGEAAGQEISRQFSGELIQGEFSGQLSGKFVGEFSGEASGEFSGEFSGELAGKLAGEMSGDFSGEMAGEVSGELSGEIMPGEGSGDMKAFEAFSGESSGDGSGESSGEASGAHETTTPF